MSLHEIVTAAMKDVSEIYEIPDGVRVTTSCIFPSGALVSVLVRGGENFFTVSDDGAAFSEIESVGATIENPERAIRHVVRAYGLECDGGTKKIPGTGAIYRPHVDKKGLALAIVLVANASKDAADYLFSTTKIARERNFKLLLRSFLEARFSERVRSEVLVGHSNKPHKFENIIFLESGIRIIVDPVMHDLQSVNARVVANMDVKLENYPKLEQRIVYDDDEDWKAEDLSLLQVGSTTVIPFSKAANVLGRLTSADW